MARRNCGCSIWQRKAEIQVSREALGSESRGRKFSESPDGIFPHRPHGEREPQDQAHVKTATAEGGGRKASLYMGLVLWAILVQEVDGASLKYHDLPMPHHSLV